MGYLFLTRVPQGEFSVKSISILFRPARALACAAALAMGFASADAQTMLDVYQGPRQFALGGAGVALPDRGRSANYNPALPALSFPRNRIGIALHPTWRDAFQQDFRNKDWNAPLPFAGDLETMAGSLLAWPAAYFPRFGYLALDRSSFHSEWTPDWELQCHALTWSVAPDFAGEPGFDTAFTWTGGITLKHSESRYIVSRNDAFTGTDILEENVQEGFAFDLGWAWRWTRIPFLPGLRANLGLAFLNLGPTIYPERNAVHYYNFGEATPAEYRVGWSLEYRPFEPLAWAGRKWSPLRILATQEFEKEFWMYGSDGNPRPFFISFFKDMHKNPDRYYDETYLNAGLEFTLAEVLYLRAGRGRNTYYWLHPTWSFGYGFNSGPLFRNLFFSYEYARVLNLGAGRVKDEDEFGNRSWSPSPREYGFQLGYLF
jgi:hypothetical protein